MGLLWREEYYLDDDEDRKEIEGKAELVISTKQRRRAFNFPQKHHPF